MSFDFHEQIVDDDGTPDDEAFERYSNELARLLEESPEAQEIRARGYGTEWVYHLVHYGVRHLGVAPASMTADALDEIVFELFPRKISCESDVAPAVVAVLRAFFRFVERAFGFSRAAECLAVLGDGAEARLAAAFDDEGNWGMAKSMIMGGRQAGYDMTSEEGLNAWMTAYNASLEQRGPTQSSPRFFSEPVETLPSGPTRDEREARRRKRKAQKAARKRGR